MQRVFHLAKINKALKTYSEKTKLLTSLDKRLLKGFYVNNLNELERSSDDDVNPIDGGGKAEEVERLLDKYDIY